MYIFSEKKNHFNLKKNYIVGLCKACPKKFWIQGVLFTMNTDGLLDKYP